MTSRVYLHVGAPKSGTTFLQGVLEANRQRLADAGVLLVGDRHLDRIHAALQVREDKRLADLPEASRHAWTTLVRQIAEWPGDSAVLSYELFAAASADQARRALADLSAYDVHVVVTGRDLGRVVVSGWQERLKFGLTTPLEQWTPKDETDGGEWGWHTLDPAAVAERWGSTLPADHVHVVTAPGPGAPPHELWHRFAEACGLGDVRAGLEVARANESLGVVQAELLRRVNVVLAPEIQGSRQRSVWIRDLLAQDVLGPLGQEPIGTTETQVSTARETWERSVERIRSAGYAVHGDLDDLRPADPAGRLPGDVGEAELVEAATRCIAALVVELRDRRVAQRTAPVGGRARLRHLAERATAPYANRRVRQLSRRVEELEREVQASRRLHLRVAALQDVVTELLLDPEQQDVGITEKALRDYRRGAL
jgi:hypothetical protein